MLQPYDAAAAHGRHGGRWEREAARSTVGPAVPSRRQIRFNPLFGGEKRPRHFGAAKVHGNLAISAELNENILRTSNKTGTNLE
jgi:hypothetical protein